MTFTDHYFASGATSTRSPFESSHSQTLQPYQQNLQVEVDRAIAKHDSIVIIQATTLFTNYAALPSGAWDHGVVDELLMATKAEVASLAKRWIPSNARSPIPSVYLAWGRFHRTDGRTGYQQHWILPRSDFGMLGDTGASSIQVFLGCLEHAWIRQRDLEHQPSEKFELHPHDRFCLCRGASTYPPLDSSVEHPASLVTGRLLRRVGLNGRESRRNQIGEASRAGAAFCHIPATWSAL